VLVAPVTGSLGFIAAAAVGLICVQALDAVIGGRSGDRLKTIGPAVIAVANTAVLIWALLS
jgi:hypothetical protein